MKAGKVSFLPMLDNFRQAAEKVYNMFVDRGAREMRKERVRGKGKKKGVKEVIITSGVKSESTYIF